MTAAAVEAAEEGRSHSAVDWRCKKHFDSAEAEEAGCPSSPRSSAIGLVDHIPYQEGVLTGEAPEEEEGGSRHSDADMIVEEAGASVACCQSFGPVEAEVEYTVDAGCP